jgi:hypothetical protein
MKRSLAEDFKRIDIKQQISGAMIGKITDITRQGQVLVEFPENILGPLVARFAESIAIKLRNIQGAVDRKVLLVFEDNDPKLPIIIDIVCDSIGEGSEKDTIAVQMDDPEHIFIDGKKVTFNATDQIILRCGKSSITLSRAGKVLIKGAYLLNRSSGVNRIRGASVQIN